MNGVEILNQTTVYETKECWGILWVFIGAGFLISFGIAIYNWVRYGFDADLILLIGYVTLACCIVGFMGVGMSVHYTDTVDYIEYQVTVSDDVNFNEFYSKYEIINQKGKIYTIKEKE